MAGGLASAMGTTDSWWTNICNHNGLQSKVYVTRWKKPSAYFRGQPKVFSGAWIVQPIARFVSPSGLECDVHW